MSDPLRAKRATFVATPDTATDALGDVVWFEVGGDRIALRPIHADDKDALLEGFMGMSDQSRYQRFLAPIDRLSPKQVIYLTEIDQINHFAWVAGSVGPDGELHGLGVARYVRSPDGDDAELAIAVADPAQGRGIGTLLVAALVEVAAARSIREIYGLLLAENEPMQRLFRGLGATFRRESPGVLRATVALPATTSLEPVAIEALVRVADDAATPPI